MAASAGNPPANAPTGDGKIPDTGPVPLPPPPGDELPIGEASGLLNLSHLASAASSSAPRPRPMETFGGQTVTPPSNGSSPSAPQPVVVVAGPAPRHAAPWIKWAALGGVALSLVLGAALIYVLLRPPVPVVTALPPKITVEPSHPVEDKPIAILGDPSAPQAPGTDPHKAQAKRPIAAAKKGGDTGTKIVLGNQPPGTKPAAPVEDDSPGGHALKIPSRTQAVAKEVSESSIAQVVSQNHRSLGVCYERVLKHDNSLKKAKLTAKVTVGISGTVKSAIIEDAEFKTSEIGQCLTTAIRNWHFPANADEYTTEIPLLLQAN
jgi:hypothetical protein